MSYLISILPILIYLLAIKAMDAFSFTTWRRLGACFIMGVLSCAVVFSAAHLIQWEQTWISPLVEETLKSLCIIYLIYNKASSRTFSIAFFAEAMVYGMAVGAGFSLIENTLYVAFNTDISLVECAIRGFGTALIHMGCTTLVATSLLTIQRIKSIPRPLGAVIAVSIAFAFHFVYNLFLIPPFVQLHVVVVVFVALFFSLYQIEEKLISRWLDISILDDVRLYGAIKEGKLGDTRAGRYLEKLKGSFNPEVFFDMLVYLQLYLELSLKAKSRLMLREAELCEPLSEAEHEENLQKIAELSTLRRNIGVTGLSAIAPVIHEKNADDWVIKELL